MNTGKVYFSSNQRLNHAAINPAFSLMESLSKQKDFGKQYRFMEAAQADELIKNLVDPSVLDSTAVVPDTLRTTLFKTEPQCYLCYIGELLIQIDDNFGR